MKETALEVLRRAVAILEQQASISAGELQREYNRNIELQKRIDRLIGNIWKLMGGYVILSMLYLLL